MYRFDSNDSNQEGAGAVIMSKSRDKLKIYLNYQSVYGHQTRQDGELLWWAPVHKVTWLFDHLVL